MALLVWMPLTKDLHNQGLTNITVSNSGASYSATGGKLGGTYVFNSTNKTQVYCSSAPILEKISEKSFSICCWAKLDAANSPDRLISITYGIMLNISGFVCYNSAGYRTATIKDNIDKTKWHHYCGTYDTTTGTMSYYIDGVLLNTYAGPTAFKSSWTNNFGIGVDWNDLNNTACHLSGSINDVRIYDSLLSPSEVKELSMGKILHIPGNEGGIIKNQLDTNTSVSSNWSKGGWGGTISIVDGNTFKLTSNSGWETHAFKCTALLNKASTVSFDMMVPSSESTDSMYFCVGRANSATYCGETIWTTPKDTWIHKVLLFDASDTTHFDFMVRGTDSSNKNGVVLLRNLKIEEGKNSSPLFSNPGEGGKCHDISGLHNDLTPSGSPGLTGDTKRYERAVSIGSSDTFTCANPFAGLGTNLEWTCCAWVKLNNTNNSQFLNDFNSGNRIIHSSALPLLYLNSGSNDYYTYGSAVSANKWMHIAFVFKNSTGRREIWRNGVNISTGGPNATSTPGTLGSTITWFSGFTGLASDIRMYATALSEADIKELASLGTPD